MRIFISPNMYVINVIDSIPDEECLISKQNIAQKLWILIASMKKPLTKSEKVKVVANQLIEEPERAGHNRDIMQKLIMQNVSHSMMA